MNKKSQWLAAGLVCASTLALPVWAKLPATSDEAKAKAAETAAKGKHGDKVAAYKLCKSMDRVAVAYHAQAKKAGTPAKPATATPPCADPGVFVYVPAPPASAVAAAPAAVTAPVPAPKK